MRVGRLVLGCLCATLLVICAEKVRPRPAAKVVAAPLDSRPGHALREGNPATPAEWTEVEKWMRENCPNRLEFLNRLSDRPEIQQRARQLVVEKYRVLSHTVYQPLRDSLVYEAQIQDQIFGAQVRFRESPRKSPRRQQARLEVQAGVAKLLDAEVRVCNARISRLQGEIKRLQENKSGVVNAWTRNMLQATRDPSATDGGVSAADVPASEPSDLQPAP